MPEHLDSQWDDVRRSLRAEVTDFVFHVWLSPLRVAALRDGTLFVRAPGHIRTWVQERYLPLIAGAASRAVPGTTSVELVADNWAEPIAPVATPTTSSTVRGESLNPRYAFDQFVICEGNRLAHAAALAVAEHPAQAYNPLFIFGRPGLGKTHLLHAIGNYVNRYGGGLKVRYTTVEEFTSSFVRAARAGDTSAFKERFRGVDVLLVDDIQFLADKARTKEEFFHTFNALYESGRQMVITSDRSPAQMGEVETRLAERFEWGLVADLEPPDYDARLAILEKRVHLDGLAGVPHDTMAAIAERVTASVRALEGALIRVVAYASLRGEPVTAEHADRLLGRLDAAGGRHTRPVERIQAATASAFGLTRDQLLASDRRPRVALARQVAMYLAREMTTESLPALGRDFAGRNHSTILHAHQRIVARMAVDSETTATVERLTRQLENAP